MWNKYGKNSIKLGRLPDIFTQYGTMKIGIIADVLESAVNGNTIRYIIVRQAHDTKTNLNDCVKFLEQKKLLAGSREDAINSSQLYSTTERGIEFLEEYKKAVLLGLDHNEYHFVIDFLK